MIIGACGVYCSICRLYVSGTCTGCARGDECPVDKVNEFACPILRCATTKGVPFCVRDCVEYPCALYQGRLSICERSVPQFTTDQTVSTLTHAGLQATRDRAGEGMIPDDVRQSHHPLSIYCLGPLRVFRDGELIKEEEWGQTKGPTQKIKALFAYLLAKGAHGATKDAIVELLWGDQLVNKKMDARFHAAFYYLRRALEPDLPSRTESRYFIHENGFFKLISPGGMWVDAAAFEDYYRTAQRLEKEGQEDVATRFYKLAEALYQGDYMIDLSPTYTEDYIDDCCKWHRYQLKEMRLTILLKLAHYHFRCNQDQLSLTYAQKALDQDRGCEEAHRLAMRLMHRSSQPYDLLCQYRLCERSLAETENRSPSPETINLYKQLLQSFQTP